MCNKMYFSSSLEARKEIKHLKSSGGKAYYKKNRAYKCEFCDGYHLTSISKRDVRLKLEAKYQTYDQYKLRFLVKKGSKDDE